MAYWHNILQGTFITTTSYQAESITYFNAVTAAGGSLTTAQKNAWDAYVVGSKADGTWALTYAVYPMMGGTAACHAINAKNPGTYNITWGGTVTHSANGVQGDGATGYGRLGLTPSAVYSGDDNFIAFYGRTDSMTAPASVVDFGCTDGAYSWDLGVYNISYGWASHSFGNTQPYVLTFDQFKRTSGTFLANRLSTVCDLRSGNTIFANGTSSASGRPTQAPNICGFNSGGGNTYFTNKQYSFLAVGQGLTNTQANSLNTAIDTLQTALSRATPNQAIGFIGDSITARNDAGNQRYDSDGTHYSPSSVACTSMATLRGYSYININWGENSTSAADWQPASSRYLNALKYFKAARCKYVSIMLGPNDAQAGTSASTFATNMQNIANDLVSNGFKVIINYPMWFDQPVAVTYYPTYTVATFNLLQTYAAALDGIVNGTTIIKGDSSSWAYFQANPTQLVDGLHPNGTGINSLANLWYNAYNTIGV